ncbi:MAG: hypothetical protein AAGF81_18995 [Pseudomonadota bacterium]
MRVSAGFVGVTLCCVSTLVCAHGAKPYLGLKGQLYFEDEPNPSVRQVTVPRHVPSKYVARTPLDFSYPESAASAGLSHEAGTDAPSSGEHGWNLELGDGAKLKFDYDEDTRLSLGMGMWKVKVGVSKSFGGPSGEEKSAKPRPERLTSAAGMGRIETASSY